MVVPTLKITKISKPFTLYLDSQGLSPNSKRNYLADTNHFFNWFLLYSQSHHLKIDLDNPYKISQNITEKILKNYFYFLSKNNIAPTTIKRRLSSLRLLGKFFISQGWWQENKVKKMTINPEKKETNISQRLLTKFAKSLKEEGKSPSTIRNYLADIKGYLEWSQNK